jgi:hypothetical protein
MHIHADTVMQHPFHGILPNEVLPTDIYRVRNGCGFGLRVHG